MAKKKAGASTTTTKKAAKEPKPPKEKKAKAKKAPKVHQPPAEPFGDVLPNYERQGSPADKNWKPKGDPVSDIATLESQERFLYRIMVRSKAERDVAKANAKLVMCQAEETSVTDGFPVDEKIALHKQADSSERKAAKADKEYKRAREGWNAVKGTLHRYLTEPERPLFDQKKKGTKAA